MYTNHNFVTETIGPDDAKDEGETKDKELETKDKKKDKK